MGNSNTKSVRQHRDRQRAAGLRPVRMWLPDTSTPEFAAQVAHAIAVAKAADDAMSTDERAEWEFWESLAFEDLPPAPAFRLPDEA
jgi:hypothetical protein